ncbi:MAG: hypothetical protein ACR2RV_20575 [Verrucomicrobiales bacterium]
MKNTWIVARIVCALVAIFSLGIWVGRLTAPEAEVVRLNARGNEIVVEENGRERGTRADKVTQQVVRRYRAELNLNKAQMEEIRPLFMATGKEMVRFPPNSKERIDILLRFHQQIEPTLDEEQRAKLKVLRPGGR